MDILENPEPNDEEKAKNEEQTRFLHKELRNIGQSENTQSKLERVVYKYSNKLNNKQPIFHFSADKNRGGNGRINLTETRCQQENKR